MQCNVLQSPFEKVQVTPHPPPPAVGPTDFLRITPHLGGVLCMITMVDELEAMWKKLSFTEEEDEGIKLRSSSTKAAKEVGKNYVLWKKNCVLCYPTKA